MTIKENFNLIQERIEKACLHSGRTPQDVTLMAITKTRMADEVLQALDLGIKDIGENRVQELLDKYPALSGRTKIHFVGQLQTNKVKYIIDKVHLVHSVDRLELAKEINRQSMKHGICVDVLVEINIASEPTKAGIKPVQSELAALAEQLQQMPGIRLKGLMTVAPNISEDTQLHNYFEQMRNLSEFLHDAFGIAHPVLSMGMSNDYTQAIEEGATIIRLGTALFGARQVNIPDPIQP